MVYIAGFGSLRNYYKDALDKLGVTVNVVRVGTFKSAVEPFIANEPSAAGARGRQGALRRPLEDLRRRGREGAQAPAGSIMRGIDEAPQRLAAAGGDAAKFALAEKLVDALKTRDELRALMIERGAKDDDENTFRQISFDDYLGHVKPPLTGDAIGVVVAEGEIVDGTAPAGTIGGLSTANLIKKARDNKDVKALVLRVDSPGGSVFGSELVRRELELTRAAGKPVVVSMGNVAASGGYWISTASDEIVADAATITGSIGVFALLPTADQTLAKLGVHPAGVGTTWLRNADDPRLPLDPRLADLVQKSVDHTYLDFTTKVAAARKTTAEKIDAVAQGRVWTGAQAKERGLVDTIGQFGDAVRSAATRAKLGDKPRIVYIEREPGRFAQLVSMLNAQVASLVGAQLDARIGAAVGVAPPLVHGARATSAGSPRSPSAGSRSRRSSTVSAAKRTELRPVAAGDPQSSAARGRPPPGRPVPRARRRRLGQDARHRPQDRAPARGRLRAGRRSPRSPSPTRPPPRCASARKALVGGRAAAKLAVSTFHSLGVRILRERRRARSACRPTSASSTATTSSAS